VGALAALLASCPRCICLRPVDRRRGGRMVTGNGAAWIILPAVVSAVVIAVLAACG
jgi:hypothetical protein